MKTAPVFSSNMVLQRGKNVRIFGQCDADENIRVSIPELQIGTEALVSNGSARKSAAAQSPITEPSLITT